MTALREPVAIWVMGQMGVGDHMHAEPRDVLAPLWGAHRLTGSSAHRIWASMGPLATWTDVSCTLTLGSAASYRAYVAEGERAGGMQGGRAGPVGRRW